MATQTDRDWSRVEWASDAEVAEWLGLARATIRTYRRRGGPLRDLAVRHGRTVRYHLPTLRAALMPPQRPSAYMARPYAAIAAKRTAA